MIVMTPPSRSAIIAGAARSGSSDRSPVPVAALTWRSSRIPLSPATTYIATPPASVAACTGEPSGGGGNAAACSVPEGTPVKNPSSYDLSQYQARPSGANAQCATSAAMTRLLLGSPSRWAFNVSTPSAVGRADQATQSPAGAIRTSNLVMLDSRSSAMIAVSILGRGADPSPI